MTDDFQKLEDHLETAVRHGDLLHQGMEMAESLKTLMQTYSLDRIEPDRKAMAKRKVGDNGNPLETLVRSQTDRVYLTLKSVYKVGKWNLPVSMLFKNKRIFSSLPQEQTVLCWQEGLKPKPRLLWGPKHIEFYRDEKGKEIGFVSESVMQRFVDNIDYMVQAVEQTLDNQKNNVKQNTSRTEKAKKAIEDLLN